MTWPTYFEVFALAKPLIKHAEGYSAVPYNCAAGTPTIGWGSTRYPNGRRVTMDDPPIDQSWAEACLTSAMIRFMDGLKPLFTREPTPRQLAAILSLAYNIGIGARDGLKGDLADSTLIAKFNEGDIEGAADEFPKWNKARLDGVLAPLAGLAARRASERALFLS